MTDTETAGTKSDPTGTVTFSVFAGPGAFTPVAGPLLEKGRMHRPDTDLDYWDGEP